MKYFLLFLVFFNFSCAKQKSVLICGDHKCINKAEAKQYFEENLTLEVQIISKNKKSSFDLINLNMGDKDPEIKIIKNDNKKIVKKLSKDEIMIKKAEIKQKNKEKESALMSKKLKRDNLKIQKREKKISSYNSSSVSTDICLKLENCDIESITNYLIKVSIDKDYPNISLKE